VHAVPLVEGVDLAAFGDGDVGVSEDELAEGLARQDKLQYDGFQREWAIASPRPA
jgi:hypothetical protein